MLRLKISTGLDFLNYSIPVLAAMFLVLLISFVKIKNYHSTTQYYF